MKQATFILDLQKSQSPIALILKRLIAERILTVKAVLIHIVWAWNPVRYGDYWIYHDN